MKLKAFFRWLAAGFVVGWCIFTGAILSASADVFTVDPTQSSLTLSGSIFGNAIAPQGPGSLTTTYVGTIQATQTVSTIQFTGSSLITAQTNGSWQPLAGGGAGNAPADYGGVATSVAATAYAAFRSIVLDVTNAPVPVTNGQFSASSLTFSFSTNVAGALDYRYSGLASGSGSKLASGNSTNNVATLATLTTNGNTLTLTLGVNVKFTFTLVSSGDTIVNVVGQIVATRSLTASPLVLQTPTVTNQVVTLKWQSPAGQFFQVQSSSNLIAWQTNASGITSGSTSYIWTATNLAPKGFYRLAH